MTFSVGRSACDSIKMEFNNLYFTYSLLSIMIRLQCLSALIIHYSECCNKRDVTESHERSKVLVPQKQSKWPMNTLNSSRNIFRNLVYIHIYLHWSILFSNSEKREKRWTGCKFLIWLFRGDRFKKSFTVLVLEKHNVTFILHEYALRERAPQGTENRLKVDIWSVKIH